MTYHTDTNFAVVYHHNDADGIVSAAIINNFSEDNVQNISVGYNTPINNSAILNNCTGKNVAIVDFSFPRKTMEFIQSCVKSNPAAKLLWIDHHISSEPLKDMMIEGIHDISKAACTLTWDYFHTDTIPDVVKFTGDRDIWKFDYEETEAYCAGLNTFGITDPASDFWKALLDSNDYSEEIIKRGQIIVDKIATDCLWHSRMRVFLVKKDQDEFLLSNCTANISECADYMIKKFKVDKVLIWDITKGHLGLHGRGKGVKDFFNGLLKGHAEACGGSIDLPEGWDFIKSLYAIAKRIT